jgi:hypothetical protein
MVVKFVFRRGAQVGRRSWGVRHKRSLLFNAAAGLMVALTAFRGRYRSARADV